MVAGSEASEGAGLGAAMVGEEVVPIKGSEVTNVSMKNNNGASSVEKKNKNDFGGSSVLNEKRSQDSIIINENHVDTYVGPYVHFGLEDNGNLDKVPFGPLDYDSSDVQSIDWSKADSTFSAD